MSNEMFYADMSIVDGVVANANAIEFEDAMFDDMELEMIAMSVEKEAEETQLKAFKNKQDGRMQRAVMR